MSANAPSAESDRPRVLLLSLEYDEAPWFDDMFSHLIDKISDRAQLQRAKTRSAGLNSLNSCHPNAILVTDAGVTRPKNNEVLDKVKEYAMGGGRVIFGGLFSGFARPNDIKQLFHSQFNLPWETGDYHRTTLHLNQNAVGGLSPTERLPASYSQKALYLKNVQSTSAIYLPSAESHVESHVFAPEPISNLTQTPAAWQKFGEGFIGYIGDVNAEQETDEVVLAMCGI